MATKSKSFGQFDQGPGQKYAKKKKTKSRARERHQTRSDRPAATVTGGRVSAEGVAADMRKHRRSVLRMGQ